MDYNTNIIWLNPLFLLFSLLRSPSRHDAQRRQLRHRQQQLPHLRHRVQLGPGPPWRPRGAAVKVGKMWENWRNLRWNGEKRWSKLWEWLFLGRFLGKFSECFRFGWWFRRVSMFLLYVSRYFKWLVVWKVWASGRDWQQKLVYFSTEILRYRGWVFITNLQEGAREWRKGQCFSTCAMLSSCSSDVPARIASRYKSPHNIPNHPSRVYLRLYIPRYYPTLYPKIHRQTKLAELQSIIY